MEELSVFIAIVSLVWAVFSIILFFKIWGMTNDVRKMKDHFLHNEKKEQKTPPPAPENVKFIKG